MSTKSLISIITINYNQAKVTNELLKSLQSLSWLNKEIIVVDNCSEFTDFFLLNTSYTDTIIIRNEKNLGFAGANNVGIKHSKGDYILLLNNDTEVESGFLEPMIRLFESNSKIGAISPKIKYYYQPELIQYAGFSKVNPFTLRIKGWGFKKKDSARFNKAYHTNYAHGCAMMVPRKVITEVGMMPEHYFLYYEEHDWSTAIKRKNYQIWYQPESIVLHKESVTVKKDSPLKTYFLNRNRILYMKRNFNIFQRIISSLYLLSISIPFNTMKFFMKKEKKHLQAYWDAIIWNINHKTKKRWTF